MSAITERFNKSKYGIILPYNSGHYEAYIVPSDDDGSILVHYHKAGEAMPAFDSDSFATIEDADSYLSSELKGLDFRTIKNLDPTEEW